MKIIISVIISSFFLESIISNYVAINSHIFIPLFSIISLVIIYPYFNNVDYAYLKYCALIGLAYDLIFTNTLIFNMVIFVSVGLIIKIVNFFISNNPINVTILSLVAITSYRIITYIILVIVGYFNFDLYYLIKGIYSSLLLNIIYGLVIYLITDYLSKRYKIPKID